MPVFDTNQPSRDPVLQQIFKSESHAARGFARADQKDTFILFQVDFLLARGQVDAHMSIGDMNVAGDHGVGVDPLKPYAENGFQILLRSSTRHQFSSLILLFAAASFFCKKRQSIILSACLKLATAPE